MGTFVILPEACAVITHRHPVFKPIYVIETMTMT